MGLQIETKYLQNVKEALIRDGFEGTLLQTVKPGQTFGLVKKLDDTWEMHARGFVDGRLDCEIEASRDYLEHLNDRHRRDATSELANILDNYYIPYYYVDIPVQSETGFEAPTRLTPWKPFLTLALLTAFIVWVGNRN